MEKHSELNYTLRDLLPIGLTFVVTGIVLAFGVQVTSEIQADMTSGTAEYNATRDTIGAVGELTSRMDTLALVTIAAVIIGVLLTAFAFRQ